MPRDAIAPAGVTVETLGCRLNAAEAETMARLAAEAGLSDAVVVNTCAVTAEAVRQARQSIRRLKRARPGARVIVTGCAAQTEPDSFAAMPEVDLVLGNRAKTEAATWAALAAPDAFRVERRVRIDDLAAARETAGHIAVLGDARARAFVEVQNGCDHACTFCIIPKGRGPSRSAAAGEVVEAIRRLVAAGRREVALTGVDLTSWGQDLPGRPRLGDLVRRILTLVPELPRLRLSSIDGAEADDALIATFADPRMAPHAHLSLQSGSDLILKRMKRRHSRAEAIALCARLRAARPDIALGADLIAGFPTETEADAADTEALVAECGLTYLHVFGFSARPGTPAARMPRVAPEAIAERAARLRALGAERLAAYLAGEVGATRAVLVEGPRRGRTGAFAEVEWTDAPGPVGAIAPVVITGASATRLSAAPIVGGPA